jgi:hypothetical protein
MTPQSHYAFLIKATVLFARDETEMTYASERVQNYLGTRIASFHELLQSRNEICVEHLRSAHNLVVNLAAAHDEVCDRDDRGRALHRAILRDTRDELEAAITALESAVK